MLTARTDGRLEGAAAASPFMAPRLQGRFDPRGRLELALWGSGDLGALAFAPLEGPFVYGPNMAAGPAASFAAAQSAPVLLLRGIGSARFTPARRGAAWDRGPHPAPELARTGALRRIRLGWGVVLIEARGTDLVVAAGEDEAEARAGLALQAEAILAEALAYGEACDRLPEADAELRSMVLAGVHAMRSAVRRDAAGRFAGLAAGIAYSAPARTYYRDGYWTLQGLLDLAPDAVAGQIELLAAGVQANGEAPSGVIVSGARQAEAWEARRLASGAHGRPGDWWSDHFDSPLFFVLTLADFVRATGDPTPAARHWRAVRAVIDRYLALRRDGLPVKPRHDRDWADNVYRAGHVAYDLGLWVGALDAAAWLARGLDPAFAVACSAEAAAARAALHRLWRPAGWYADYDDLCGFSEDHLALDSLTLLRWNAVPEPCARQVLDACRARLESRHNTDQPYGDWGVLCAFPPYGRRRDLRAKSAFPYRYHNGGDWPWLDALYAEARLRRGLPGWRYPLTRWWRASLAAGWPGAVEYFSPPYAPGSPLQGWSGFPAAVALAHRAAVLAGDPDTA